MNKEQRKRYDDAPLQWLKTKIHNKYTEIYDLLGGLKLIYGNEHPLTRYGNRLASSGLDLHVNNETTYDKEDLEYRDKRISGLLDEMHNIYKSVNNK